MQSRCGGVVVARLRLPRARSRLLCPIPACCNRCRLAGAGSGSNSGVDDDDLLLFFQKQI
jgi:hypothetical protein